MFIMIALKLMSIISFVKRKKELRKNRNVFKQLLLKLNLIKNFFFSFKFNPSDYKTLFVLLYPLYGSRVPELRNN